MMGRNRNAGKPGAKNPGKTFKRIFAEIMSKYKVHCIAVVICLLISAVANVYGTMFMQRLIDECNLTQDALSEKVGKKRSSVSNYLRLLKLPAPVQMGLQNKQIDMGHARALVTLGDPKLQVKIFEEILEQGYSVRKVEEIVKSLSEGEAVKSGGRKIAPKRAKLPEEFNMLKQQLSGFFSTKVQLTCSEKGKGKISIPFNNEEELERIIGILDTLKK